MVTSTEKTHLDYLDVIGSTVWTARSYREKRLKQYHFSRYVKAVSKLLQGEVHGTILDVGCSHGGWLRTWEKMGFSAVHGVEASHERARLAEQTGYDKVFNCDAQNMPIPDNTYRVAFSSGVFVHLLHIETMVNVLNECYRVLKPGGIFVFNFVPPGDTVVEYCCFYSLDTMIRHVVAASDFRLGDIATSWFHPYTLLSRLAWALIALPASVTILRLNDFFFSSRLPIQKSAALYFKLRKGG